MAGGYPDKQLVLDGLQNGFRLGCSSQRHQLKATKHNIPSAYEHPEVVEAYLLAECQKGRVLGPFPSHPVAPLQISRFGVIPKRSQPGKWRLILDLSFPEDSSVNAGISKEYCSLRYPSLDMAITQILQAGQNAQLSKLDIKDAYRIIQVHPADWGLLGMQRQGQFYVDQDDERYIHE